MWLDRTPHPAVHEVKNLYQPIKVSLEKGTLEITNTQFFETIQGLEFSWPTNGDGCELGIGVLSLPLIETQSSFGIGWKSGPWASDDLAKLATIFKSKKRNEMVKEGYRILGNSGDQWSDLLGA